jgi:nucleoid-associated protein YgaU
VPPGGQQFYEIARETLGSGARWSEIYQLNQQLDPRQMVPEGTQLKLPADAHMGQ